MLVNEIGAQQSLLWAEDGNLPLNPVKFHSLKLLRKLEICPYSCVSAQTLTGVKSVSMADQCGILW